MPPQTVSLKPQTSRQAKRAYQKAGGAPRLSAIEQRRLERSAELEERAARIRAHNTRARERKRKKAEKLEKERETRKRMGIPEPIKTKVTPSQLSLGAFVETKPTAKMEAIQSPRIHVKEEKATRPLCTTHCMSKTESKEQPKFERQLLQRCKPELPLQKSIPLQFPPPIRKVNKANSSALMPPPRSRAPLRNTSANRMPIPGSTGQKKDDLDTIIGNDWDSLFASNTQVEREISGCEEDPPAQYSLPRITPAISVNTPPPPTIPSELLAGISTQDLQYSSSPTSPAREGSVKAPKPSAEYRSTVPPSDLRKSNGTTTALQKKWPQTVLRRDELDTIWFVLLDSYYVDLSPSEIRQLISGQHLNGDGSIIPPRLVTLMAIKIEEERKPGKSPPVPMEIWQWAISMRRKEAREERQAAAARQRRNSLVSKTRPLSHDFPPRNSGAMGSKSASADRLITTPKSFDEFDDFDLSVEDLRELDV
ncbi:MAG: hypothetical protein L6R41_005168 [Letrouitia leprolyta]|nr:MAG: hypothetical protein L6R41_005168 [Letrouitia leprolyta]